MVWLTRFISLCCTSVRSCRRNKINMALSNTNILNHFTIYDKEFSLPDLVCHLMHLVFRSFSWNWRFLVTNISWDEHYIDVRRCGKRAIFFFFIISSFAYPSSRFPLLKKNIHTCIFVYCWVAVPLVYIAYFSFFKLYLSFLSDTIVQKYIKNDAKELTSKLFGGICERRPSTFVTSEFGSFLLFVESSQIFICQWTRYK